MKSSQRLKYVQEKRHENMIIVESCSVVTKESKNVLCVKNKRSGSTSSALTKTSYCCLLRMILDAL